MSSVDQMTELYCCPETQQPLEVLDDERLEQLNEAIRAGELQSDGGEAVERTLDAGLVRQDGAYVYPVRDGVPDLLPSDRIEL